MGISAEIATRAELGRLRSLINRPCKSVMSGARANYWIKGAVSPEGEIYVAAVNKDSSLLYVLTYGAEPAVLRDSNITVGGGDTPLLIFDPRPLAQLGQVVRARLLNVHGTSAQILLVNSPSSAHSAVSTQQAPDSKAQVATPAAEPATLNFVEQTGVAVDEIRAEGRYVLRTAKNQDVEWYRFLPVGAKVPARKTAAVTIQKTTRNVPYADVTDGIRLLFIPAKLYEETSVVTDRETLLSRAKDFIDYAAGAAPLPSRAYTSEEEVSKGWYEVCHDGQGCGSCYGKCPGDAVCAVSYDKEKRKISYVCGYAPEEAEWYQNWWVLALIGVVVLVVLVILLMLALARSSPKNRDED